MHNRTISAVVLATTLAAALPAFAQQATDAPATATPAPAVEPAPAAPLTTPAPGGAAVIVAPEGYTVTELGAVTAEQLEGVDIYDAAGGDVAEIADVVIGTDGKVSGLVTDVGGFLGLGEHRISLSPEQVQLYKNADNDIRAYVNLTKDELKALPAYVAP